VLLRRITEHVKAQNWFAVGLDFVIVVVGVFVGLQVSNWNDARQAREDGGQFLVQLHDDIVLAKDMSSRVLDRRLQRAVNMVDAADVLFGRVEATALTQAQCTAIFSSPVFEVPIAALGSFDELVASGRVAIISDASLRTDLLALRQIAITTREAIGTHSLMAAPLEQVFPEAIENDAYFDEALGEVRAHIRCNEEAMRSNRAFLNAMSVNIDAQDAFIRDGLGAWNNQIVGVHKKVDAALGITHNEGSAP